MERTSSITYRPVLQNEQRKAIELWQSVFEAKSDGYFERFFSSQASPDYREGDTLGAWAHDDRLVSIVQIRRSILISDKNETFLCGVISNVATDVEFRNQGLSKQLLSQAIEKMERENFSLSMLGTGQPQHYLKLGWKPLRSRIQYVINLKRNDLSTESENRLWIPACSVSSYDKLLEIYSTHPRPYQFDRCSSSLFEHWIGWHWKESSAFLYISPDHKGYIVISHADGKGCPVSITEYRAFDHDTEKTLLEIAAVEIYRRYRQNSFLLHTLPQYTTLQSLGWNDDNNLIFEENEDVMLRNIGLSDEQYQTIKTTFEAVNGKTTIWPGEYF
ncbi:unnamed protein product [Adineta ricciae]|uniref:N-acetyltransferase domain-containing protein n=1 Tax=Adineta ricciae TaxID=249248 RepID=A0A816BAW9_ADIRI|nr:unnamed protein product [Adineta ricciae]CAF1607696.1 unnamed protein product [Adineta ricciae]